MAAIGQQALESLLGLAASVAGSRVSVAVKTNLGPEFEAGQINLAGGASSSTDKRSSTGFAGLLGVEAAVILRDEQGRVLAVLGEPPATDYVRLGLILALVAALTLIVVRGLTRGR